MVTYTLNLYGTDTNLTLSNSMTTKSNVTGAADCAADISAGSQPVSLSCYTIMYDFDDVGESKTGVGDHLIKANNTRDILREINVFKMTFSAYDTFITKIQNLLSYNNLYAEVADYELDIKDHIAGSKLMKVIMTDRQIEGYGGKNIKFTLELALPNG